MELMVRGQERFNIFCAPCHDRAGTGSGMVVLTQTFPDGESIEYGYDLAATQVSVRSVLGAASDDIVRDVQRYQEYGCDLLIFDLDGTLVDSRQDLTASINHALRQMGLASLSLETVAGFVPWLGEPTVRQPASRP